MFLKQTTYIEGYLNSSIIMRSAVLSKLHLLPHVSSSFMYLSHDRRFIKVKEKERKSSYGTAQVPSRYHSGHILGPEELENAAETLGTLGSLRLGTLLGVWSQ